MVKNNGESEVKIEEQPEVKKEKIRIQKLSALVGYSLFLLAYGIICIGIGLVIRPFIG